MRGCTERIDGGHSVIERLASRISGSVFITSRLYKGQGRCRIDGVVTMVMRQRQVFPDRRPWKEGWMDAEVGEEQDWWTG